MKTNEQKKQTDEELTQVPGGGNGSAKYKPVNCSSFVTAAECKSTKGKCAWSVKHEKCTSPRYTNH